MLGLDNLGGMPQQISVLSYDNILTLFIGKQELAEVAGQAQEDSLLEA